MRSLLLVPLILMSYSVKAQEVEPFNPYAGIRDGDWLLNLCDPPPNVMPAERIDFCLSYTMGILDGYYATYVAQIRRDVTNGSTVGSYRLLCNEEQLNLYELRMLVVNYLKPLPNRSQRAHHYVLAAFRQKWKCSD